MDKRSCCAVFGEPPMCYQWGFDEEDQRCVAAKFLLLNRISYLQTKGIRHFFVPIDAGIGMYVSEIILSLRGSDPLLRLNTLIPYEDQASKWSPNLRDRYYEVLEKCSESAPVSLYDSPTCELDAMLEAIDASATVLALKSAEKPQSKAFAVALRYAEKMGKEIMLLTAPPL